MRMRNLLFACFVLINLLAVTGPGMSRFATGPGPFWLGIPFSLLWNILWIGLGCLALLVYDLTARRGSR